MPSSISEARSLGEAALCSPSLIQLLGVVPRLAFTPFHAPTQERQGKKIGKPMLENFPEPPRSSTLQLGARGRESSEQTNWTNWSVRGPRSAGIRPDLI